VLGSRELFHRLSFLNSRPDRTYRRREGKVTTTEAALSTEIKDGRQREKFKSSRVLNLRTERRIRILEIKK
jgi:hypothetical protein